MAGMEDQPLVSRDATALWAVMALTFLGSLGTGIFWNGLAFIAKHGYEFSEARNLLLFAVNGTIYAAGAFFAGRVIAWIRRRLPWACSTRQMLGAILAVQGVACLGPITFEGQWVLWVASGGVSALAATTWAIVESYMTAGRHGQAMRRSIGWFNLAWTGAVAASMFLMAPLTEFHAEWVIGGMAFVYAVCLVFLVWFSPNPPVHDVEAAAASITPEYRWLLHSARILLPVSYVLNAAMSPILPYRFAELGLSVAWETPVTGTWMVIRVLTLAVMWRANFWHGRWGTLLFGGATMTLGFAVVVTGPNIETMLAGFSLFGVGLGVVYYTALYYAMAVGHAEIDAGGTHEALIGVGYTVGPCAGLVGLALGSGAWIVGTVWTVVGLAAWPAVRPYMKARRFRQFPQDDLSRQAGTSTGQPDRDAPVR